MTVSGVSLARSAVDVQHVLLVELEPRQASHLPEVPLLHRAGIEAVEVVDAHDLVAPAHQRLDQVRADESRGPGDEDSAHRRPRPIPWYSKPSAVMRPGS